MSNNNSLEKLKDIPSYHNTKNQKLILILSIFLVSSSMFIYQITLTRIFSPMLRYHFVFMITSMAIFGLGIGGIIGYKISKNITEHQLILILPPLQIFLTSSYILSFTLIFKLPFINQFTFYSIIASLPFITGGTFISLIFKKLAGASNELYFADLAGGGIGSIIVVVMLNHIGIVNTVLVVAIIPAISSLILAFYTSRKSQIMTSIIILVILGLTTVFQSNIKRFERRFTGYFTSPFTALHILRSSNKPHSLEDYYWDAYSRTDIITPPKKEYKIVTIDGGANSPMYKFDGDLSKVDNLKSEIVYLPFQMGSNNKLLVIGPGGGKDILLGLLGGSKNIDAVEINRGSILIARKYSNYNGGIYDSPGVKVYITDGRNFVKQTDKKYDHIFLSKVMTDATEAVGFSLGENYIYTKEAIKDYWSALEEDGRLTFSLHGYEDLIRLLITVTQSLKELGLPDSVIGKYIVVLSTIKENDPTDNIKYPLVLIKKSGYTEEEILAFEKLVEGKNFKLLHLPYFLESELVDQIIKPSDFSEDISDSININLSVTTDDRPYFFDFKRGINYTLLGVLFATFILGAFIIQLLTKKTELRQSPLYFVGLGLGFMLIEIPLIQKFTLLLGHPTRSFIIVLVAILTGGGLGSMFSTRWRILSLRNSRYLPLILVTFLTVIVYTLFTVFLDRWIIFPLIIKSLISIGVLFPLGFFMGMPFPFGIRTLKLFRKEYAVPLILGLNGVMSVGGSVLAVIISMKIGLSYSLFIGGLIYLLLFLTMPLYEKGWST